MLARTARPARPAAAVRAGSGGRRGFWNLPEWYAKNARTPQQMALKAELERGYWWEGNELMRQPDGKLWHAPKTLLPATHGPAWPEPLRLPALRSIAGTPLAPVPLEGRGGAQVVLASGHRFAAWPMIESWTAPLLRDAPHLLPAGRVAELCLVADAPYAAFGFVWERLARRQAPAERHAHIGFVYGARARELRRYLGVDNRLVAYAFLLDPLARVRWRAVGHATAAELAALAAAVKQLQRDFPEP